MLNKINGAKAPLEETKEEKEAKTKAVPIKKPNPETENDSLEPEKKDDDEEKEEKTDAQIREEPPAEEGAEKKDLGPPAEKVHSLNPTDW